MSKKSNDNGASTFGLLGVAFIVLKLTHVIDWSWWWVLAPFWGGFALFGLILLIGFIYYMLKD